MKMLVSSGFWIWICILIALQSCAVHPDKKIDYNKGSSVVDVSESSIELDVLKITNKLREENGLPPVTLHQGMSNMAREHSDFMSRNSGKFELLGPTISHYGSEARGQMAGISYDVSSIGENVVSTNARKQIAEEIVRAWQASPTHCEVLMGSTYEYMGIGIRQNGAMKHGTMLMAARTVGKLPHFVGPKPF